MKTLTRSYKHRSRANHKNHVDLFDRLESLKNTLSDITGDVKDKTSNAIEKSMNITKKRATKAAKQVDRFVTKRPYKILGIAAVTFFVLGYFSHRQ